MAVARARGSWWPAKWQLQPRAPDINVTPGVRHNFLHFDTDPAARLCLELEMLVAGWVSQLSGGLFLGAPVYFLMFCVFLGF